MNNYNEIIKALLDGKPIYHVQFKQDLYYLTKGGKFMYQRNGCFPIEHPMTFDSPLCWELYEEPKKEIKLTPDMVGRKVRRKDGIITMIGSYDPEKDLKYPYTIISGADYTEEGYYDIDMKGSSSDIVEILE